MKTYNSRGSGISFEVPRIVTGVSQAFHRIPRRSRDKKSTNRVNEGSVGVFLGVSCRRNFYERASSQTTEISDLPGLGSFEGT